MRKSLRRTPEEKRARHAYFREQNERVVRGLEVRHVDNLRKKGILTRGEFDKLGEAAKLAHLNAGWKIVDE